MHTHSEFSFTSPIDELLFSCHWNAETCANKKYFTETQTDLGRCYTFNGNADDVLTTSETGIDGLNH